MIELNRKTTIIRLHGCEDDVLMTGVSVTQGEEEITPVMNGYDDATKLCHYADYIVQSGVPVTFQGNVGWDYLLLGKSIAASEFTFTPYGEVITIEGRSV